MFDSIVVLADVLAQTGIGNDVTFDGPSELANGAVGAFFTTLIVGAILIAVAPGYTERKMNEVTTDPVRSFIHGILVLILLLLMVVVLVITIVGILVAIPLLVIAYLAWAVGATVAFLTIADRLVSYENGWLKPLLVAAAINGGLTLTGIGGIISLIVGAVGFGTVLQDYL